MKTDNFTKNVHFSAAMYLRLSRDDNAARDAGTAPGSDTAKAESNSIGSQRELIRAFIQGQQDIELYDIYVEM